jgi:hypothetical protein
MTLICSDGNQQALDIGNFFRSHQSQAFMLLFCCRITFTACDSLPNDDRYFSTW